MVRVRWFRSVRISLASIRLSFPSQMDSSHGNGGNPCREPYQSFDLARTEIVGADKARCLVARLLLLLFLRPLVGFLQIFARFLEGSEGIVIRLDSLPVFVHGAFTLARDVEDFAQLEVAPDFGPAGLAIAVQGCTVGVCRRLIVSLQKENFRNAIVRQGTVLVDVE